MRTWTGIFMSSLCTQPTLIQVYIVVKAAITINPRWTFRFWDLLTFSPLPSNENACSKMLSRTNIRLFLRKNERERDATQSTSTHQRRNAPNLNSDSPVPLAFALSLLFFRWTAFSWAACFPFSVKKTVREHKSRCFEPKRAHAREWCAGVMMQNNTETFLAFPSLQTRTRTIYLVVPLDMR